MMLGPVADEGIKLLGKIFGENNLNANISDVKSPNPFVVFCRNHIDQDPIGDSLPGFSTKFCNDFFPAPTHTGICITKNLDTKEIIYLEEEYDGFFEVEKQSSKLTVGKDNYWAQTTVVINALKMDPSKVMNSNEYAIILSENEAWKHYLVICLTSKHILKFISNFRACILELVTWILVSNYKFIKIKNLHKSFTLEIKMKK